MTAQCQALNLSDERRCEEIATNGGGLFCQFHARQCFGLYKGYKRRNAQLDYLVTHPPPLLHDVAIHELDVQAVTDPDSLQECHEYLLRRYALLDRVIRARRLHHSRFYALELDYGHENYLNQLSAQRTPLLRVTETVVKRLAEVLYEQRRWFDWVRKLEDDEEQERDAEKKKVKQEAALFKRHLKQVEARMKLVKAEEDEKRQIEYLDKTWEEVRQANGKLDEEAIDDSWDPIEDNIGEERGNYVNLLRHFLWQGANEDELYETKERPEGNLQKDTDQSGSQDGTNSNINSVAEASTPKSKNAKKRARQKANQPKSEPKEPAKPGTTHVESMKEMRERLRTGQEYQNGFGWLKKGTPKNPEEWETRSPPLKPKEIDKLVSQISEIKQLLFCRLVLAHTTLLPAALRSNSVEEFLSDKEVSNTDLRDLCLKMEQPELQDIRDACADFRREEETVQENEEENNSKKQIKKYRAEHLVRQKIPQKFQTKREKSMKPGRESAMMSGHENAVDFGHIDDRSQYEGEKVKVKVCGRNVFNYPSEKAMSRGGWFQFSIIAKDCKLEDAVELCRSWDEFYELVVLTMYNYFPASGWFSFIRPQEKQQLCKLGFFPYYRMHKADDYSHRHQSGGHGGPRFHQILEIRNFICGQMKRNDPVTRRFIQYVAMHSSEMVMFVRDVATGNVLVSPPEHELWLVREKIGLGRASKAEWNVKSSVGPKFIEEMEDFRSWSLNFKDYYEVIIWDNEPGLQFPMLMNGIQALLFKAYRVQDGTGESIYKPAESILRSIAMDHETDRAYDLQPGDNNLSVWDVMTDSRSKLRLLDEDPDGDGTYMPLPNDWIYKEADRLEDQVLFPEEQIALASFSESEGSRGPDAKQKEASFLISHGKMHTFEDQGPDMNRFYLDLDTDEELSDADVDEIEDLHKGSRSPGNLTCDHLLDDQFENLDIEDEGDGDELSAEEILAFKEMMNAWDEWAEVGPEYDDLDHDTDHMTRKEMKKLGKLREQAHRAEMEEDFGIFIDRERANTFKHSWHRADLEPNARERWAEYQSLMKTYSDWLTGMGPARLAHLQTNTASLRLLIALEVDYNIHRRILRDSQMACMLVSFFFKPNHTFLSSEPGAKFKDSLLFKQNERAQLIPDRRSSNSCATRPKAQYKEWDEWKSKRHEPYPEQWNIDTRPIIAYLYREGIIATRYIRGTFGESLSITEPDRPGKPDLYFDWRRFNSDYKPTPVLEDATKLAPLIDTAQSFAKSVPSARFSVIKIWSSPHFWPLMIGHDNRDRCSFTDGIGRTWEWKFISKDMPYSEVSVHKNLGDRLDAFGLREGWFRVDSTQLVLRKDTILVMAGDVEDCRQLTEKAVFAINSRPWRLEVDPWKSWFNVDIDFLNKLDPKWWD